MNKYGKDSSDQPTIGILRIQYLHKSPTLATTTLTEGLDFRLLYKEGDV